MTQASLDGSFLALVADAIRYDRPRARRLAAAFCVHVDDEDDIEDDALIERLEGEIETAVRAPDEDRRTHLGALDPVLRDVTVHPLAERVLRAIGVDAADLAALSVIGDTTAVIEKDDASVSLLVLYGTNRLSTTLHVGNVIVEPDEHGHGATVALPGALADTVLARLVGRPLSDVFRHPVLEGGAITIREAIGDDRSTTLRIAVS